MELTLSSFVGSPGVGSFTVPKCYTNIRQIKGKSHHLFWLTRGNGVLSLWNKDWSVVWNRTELKWLMVLFWCSRAGTSVSETASLTAPVQLVVLNPSMRTKLPSYPGGRSPELSMTSLLLDSWGVVLTNLSLDDQNDYRRELLHHVIESFDSSTGVLQIKREEGATCLKP